MYEIWSEKIYRLKLDGTQRQRLSTDTVAYDRLIVSGNWIYYCNGSDNANLYKIKIDGTSRTKLNDEPAGALCLGDHVLYYQIEANSLANPADVGKLIRINLDGTGRTVIKQLYVSGSRSTMIGAFNGWLYLEATTHPDSSYSNFTITYYRMKPDGSGRMNLVSYNCSGGG
jgi:hypothetical protein